MKISEEELVRFAKAPSETEEGKCQNAVKMITEKITSRFGSDVSVFLQGSYKNRTNVRLDSDVDIVVLHEGYFFPSLWQFSEDEERQYWNNFSASSYTFEDFKSEVHRLMEDLFGGDSVTRKNKCIRVNGNSYRVNADVVPCFGHKRIRPDGFIDAMGVQLYSDDGNKIYSFPKQHHLNGVEKNRLTNTMYKPIIRILKNIRNELIDLGKIGKDDVSSFFIECLVWNVLPHTHFDERNYLLATQNILWQLYQDLENPVRANDYTEVSDLKWLFRGNLTFTPKQGRDFVIKAWNHIGYEN